MSNFMLRALEFLVLLSSAADVIAAVIPEYGVHERSTPHTLRHVKRLNPDAVLPINIYLSPPNLAEGAAHLSEIANPASTNYGQHWSTDEVSRFFEVDVSRVDEVRAWLNSTSVDMTRIKYSRTRSVITFPATVEQAENLLHTKFHRYYDAGSNSYMQGCESYSVPAHLKDSIDFITPTTFHWPSIATTPKRRNRRSAPGALPQRSIRRDTHDLSNCSNGVTPQCISTLYKIPALNNTPQEGNSMGIVNAQVNPLNESYSQQDLDSFFSTYIPHIPQGTHPVAASVDGGRVETDNPKYEGSEAMLDYSMALPIVYPQTITGFVNGAGFSPDPYGNDESVYNQGFEAFLDAIDSSYCESTGASKNASLDCGKYKPTNVISVSYGHVEYQINYKYAVRTCNEFMKLGLQGITVVASSGDGGIGHPCAANGVFAPQWFSSCPWVLTVGGTQLPIGADVTKDNVETGWSVAPGFGSGGGFSNYYPMPDYQNATVNEYLTNTELKFTSYAKFSNQSSLEGTDLGDGKGVFNRLGRAFPDVSAVANNLTRFYQGQASLDDGTSASTPIWGAIITRINEERLRVGKKTVGFINPTLYQNPQVLNDITSGSNDGFCGPGFPATKGWDPVTGLGSPDYTKLLDLFMNLP